jgi:hypothetical protein
VIRDGMSVVGVAEAIQNRVLGVGLASLALSACGPSLRSVDHAVVFDPVAQPIAVVEAPVDMPAHVVLLHRNEMSATFRLTQLQYVLDGAAFTVRAEDVPSLARVFDGLVAPGRHALSVDATYRGAGTGVFAYLQSYSFRVRSSYEFDAQSGGAIALCAIGFERGGITTPLEERPALRVVPMESQ